MVLSNIDVTLFEDRKPKTEAKQIFDFCLRSSDFGLLKRNKSAFRYRFCQFLIKVTTTDMTKSTTFVSKNDTFVTFYSKKWQFCPKRLF